jgi:TolB-like protein/DNA-binding winged helix-turn-helix (wHTH) protein/cytochrome c-type biogenesis protein CcmH/NrfG
MDGPGARSFAFGPFHFDPLRGLLRNGSERLELRPKCQAVLQYLLANPQRTVAKDELLDAVWGKVVVTEDSLVQCIGDIRQALGDDGQRVIRTIPRRGYLFVPSVSEIDAGASGAPLVDVPVPASNAVGSPFERPARRRARMSAPVLAGLFGLTAVALLISAAWGWNGVAAALSRNADLRSHAIAVLPQVNIDGDPVQEHLALGITSDLSTDLARVPGFLVISPGTALAFRDRRVGVADAAREFGVRYVVDGSVQRLSEDVRVNLRLIDAHTGAQKWAERFQGPRTDLPQLQVDVIRRIAQTLQIRLLESEAERIAREHTANPDAHDLTMRGWALWERRRPSDNAQAQALFRQAVALDPGDPLAWVGLANTLLSALDAGWTDDRPAALDQARQAMGRADAIGPRQHDAGAGRGHVLFFGGDIEAALAAFDQEVEADPGNALAHVWRGRMLISLGRAGEAIAAIERAMALSPRDVDMSLFCRSLAHAHFSQARYGEAADWAHKAVGLSPDDVKGHALLAAASALRAGPSTAAGELEQVRRLQPGFDSVAAFRQGLTPGERRTFDATPRFWEGLHAAGLPMASGG